MNPIHTNQSTGLLRIAMVLICVFLLAALTVGCGDDPDSLESKLEEARIAIDDSQYSKAISVLDGMTGQEVLEVRASAYAGLAGIDTFEILSEVGDGGSGDGSIDLIGRMLGTDDDDTLTAAAIDVKLGQIDLAKVMLLDSVDGNLASLDDDGKAKLALYGFTEVVLILGKVISNETVDGDVVLTESWINSFRTDTAFDFDSTSIDAGQLADINEDLGYVSGGIDALVNDGDNGNDLAVEFDTFLDEIDINSDGVDATELSIFLNGLGY